MRAAKTAVLLAAMAAMTGISCSTAPVCATCGGPSDASGDAADAPAPTECIVFGDAFADFRTWPRYHLEPFDGGPDASPDGGLEAVGSHLAGPRTVYINHLPPPGSKAFPMCTMIVKTVEVGPESTWQVFAMVKRGGSYNFLGAIDWEWFGLSLVADGSVKIEWRGVGPPADAGYGGPGNSACNGCHKGAVDNDYVQAQPLLLQSF